MGIARSVVLVGRRFAAVVYWLAARAPSVAVLFALCVIEPAFTASTAVAAARDADGRAAILLSIAFAGLARPTLRHESAGRNLDHDGRRPIRLDGRARFGP